MFRITWSKLEWLHHDKAQDPLAWGWCLQIAQCLMSWSLLLVYQLEFFLRVAIPFSPSAIGLMMNWKTSSLQTKSLEAVKAYRAPIYHLFLHGTHGQLSAAQALAGTRA
jgi:hypothetical protein